MVGTQPGCHIALPQDQPRAGWIGESVAPSGEAAHRWLMALSRDATLNQVGFDVRRVDGENWVMRASAPNDSRAALFKERSGSLPAPSGAGILTKICRLRTW